MRYREAPWEFLSFLSRKATLIAANSRKCNIKFSHYPGKKCSFISLNSPATFTDGVTFATVDQFHPCRHLTISSTLCTPTNACVRSFHDISQGLINFFPDSVSLNNFNNNIKLIKTATFRWSNGAQAIQRAASSFRSAPVSSPTASAKHSQFQLENLLESAKWEMSRAKCTTIATKKQRRRQQATCKVEN